MKQIILAAFAVMGLAVAAAPAAHAFVRGFPHPASHDSAYDNTPNSSGGYAAEGGDGCGD